MLKDQPSTLMNDRPVTQTSILSSDHDDSSGLLEQALHDLRNPIAAVSSTVQLLEAKDPNLKLLPYWVQLRSDISEIVTILNHYSCVPFCDKESAQEPDLK